MPSLETNCAGIKSPNPFWLASAPPANSGDQIKRAFDHGWGGAVWKTLGTPIQNVSSRFGGLHYKGTKAIGFNNIELITDRPLEVNFKEIADVKKKYPEHAVIVSLMVETKEEWKDIIKRSIDAGADGLELNFGCPHGMCERGMGSAVGQEPAVNEEITSWAVEYSTVPVLVKLTPNVGDILPHGLAAQRGGATRRIVDQHDQEHHRCRHRSKDHRAARRPALEQRWLLRCRGQAHRPAHGGAALARARLQHPDQRHRWHLRIGATPSSSSCSARRARCRSARRSCCAATAWSRT